MIFFVKNVLFDIIIGRFYIFFLQVKHLMMAEVKHE